MLSDQLCNGFFLDGLFRGVYPELLMRRAWLLRPEIGADDMTIISQPLDFLGVNYYSRIFARHAWHVPFFRAWMGDDRSGVEEEFVEDGVQYTAMGWEVYPRGLYDWLMRLTRAYNRPTLYVTENGAAFTDAVSEDGRVHDPLRIDYLQRHMAAAARAIAEGADLRGYFIWTMMDNFEWVEGYRKRFGLVYVNHRTQERIIKDSGYWLQQIIAAQRA
jgi:beta-glucosidase